MIARLIRLALQALRRKAPRAGDLLVLQIPQGFALPPGWTLMWSDESGVAGWRIAP